jgi:glycosyltransferase involved in cell wall biosynthesis
MVWIVNCLAPLPIQRDNAILTVANEFRERGQILGYDIWEHITKGLPTRVLGDNPGLSKPAENPDHLAATYAASSIYLNCTRFSPIPMSLLESAACGNIIISTATAAIPTIFTHNENALLSNDIGELRGFLEDALNNPQKYEYMRENARNLITQKFSLDSFTKRWDELLQMTAKIGYKGQYHV